MQPVRKLLAIKFRSLGDTVLMTAPLQALRTAYPQAEIHVAVIASWGELLEALPGVDRVWRYDRPKDRVARARRLVSLGFKLRQQGFDTVINFHASPSSAALSAATGALTRSIHFHGLKDKNKFSTLEVPGKGVVKPVIERDMDAVRALGVPVEAGMLPMLVVPDHEARHPGPILSIGLGASRRTKQWPIERYAELAIRWVERSKGSAVAVVDAQESALEREFRLAVQALLPPREVNERIQVEKGLPLLELGSLLKKSAVFAGNDSGPKHMAVAVGTPTVTLFGPEDPFEWHPYPRDRHLALHIDGLACRKDAPSGLPPWCGIPVCIEERHRCMTQIGVDRVYAECERLGLRKP